MVLDIPVQLSVELGRTKVPIMYIMQRAQGSVVDLVALAGEPCELAQHLDLGVHAAQLGIGEPLDRIVQRRIEAQGEGFLCGHGTISRATLR
jgi:hypothetical protein